MKRLFFLLFFVSFFQLVWSQTKVIAHRGFWATSNSDHNSITSLYKAHEIGCYGAEFDVWATADNMLVVHHDNKIGGLSIYNTAYEKLRDLKLANGEVLPTLDQYLVHAKNCGDMKLILEIKCDVKGVEYAKNIVDRIVSMVESHGLEERTEYIAFSLDICKELVLKRPTRMVSYLSGNLKPHELKALGINGLDYYFSGFMDNPNLVKEAHDLGMAVNVWTVDDSVMMKKLLAMGVDYITTDNPLVLQQVIRDYEAKNRKLAYREVDLTEFKKDKSGFITLFDGTSLKGWRNYGKEDLSDKWTIDQGTLKFDSQQKGRGGDIIFAHRFKNFELDLEWRIAKGGNSGIFYMIQEIYNQYAAASSPEFQLLDNENHPDALQGQDGNRRAGSLYDLIPATPQNTKPFGEWNRAKIVVDNGKVTHYQNGEKVLEYTLWTLGWIKMLEKSKFSFAAWEDAFLLMSNCGGVDRKGYIGFQDHGNDVSFRNVKIKVLDK